MKFIDKKANNEPADVIEKRNTPGSTFDDLPKMSLREALLKEQGFICGYCMQRIHNDGNSTKIEHWEPRNSENEKKYMNLIAVCSGNYRWSDKDRFGKETSQFTEHCDTLKKDQPITISPLNKNCETLVKFDPGGQVYSYDETVDGELDKILGLKLQHFVDERKRLIDSLKKEIEINSKNNPDKKAKIAFLRNMLKKWSTPNRGKYDPYCQVAISYINKKIARLS